MRGARGRARRPRRARWSAPATPARRWPPRCCGFGRIQGVHRPAIAVPLPMFGADRAQLLVDGGATVDPQPEWLVEWALLGRAYARVRLGVDEPTIALLSNGEEPGKGDALRKARVAAARRGEGLGRQRRRPRPRCARRADVIVTDGFTGNVALKTVEGALLGSRRAGVRRARRARVRRRSPTR